MYKIIGADRKEYGPVTVDQLKQWISQGRVNVDTMARPEGGTDWRPLGSYPEFAGDAPPPMAAAPVAATTTSFSGGSREAALSAVKGPAIALMVTAILGLLLVALSLAMHAMGMAGSQAQIPNMDPQMQKWLTMFSGSLGILLNVIAGTVGVVVLMGALKMQSLQNYQFAYTAAILAMIPCVSPCCLFGIPFGIWAIVVLNKPEIKSQFS